MTSLGHRIAFALVIGVVAFATAASGQTIVEPPARRPATQALQPETKEQHDARMRWWREARFGMFIHFGLYSVAGGQWNGQRTGGAGEWIMHDMKIPPGEYARLAGQFNPLNFDANKWARLAATAGMKYIVITTKHHDGFCLWDSKFTDYDVMSTPFRRDIMKELSQAARDNGLKIGWYHSILDWHDPDAQDEKTFATYEWRLRAQVNELLTNYGDIGVMWFDGDWIPQWNDERGEKLYKLCRSLQPQTIVNNRVGHQRGGMNGFTKSGGFAGDYATPEQEIPDNAPAAGVDWETCMTMNATWGYKRDDVNWKSSTLLIRDLIDVASKGGNFLLNVGPTGDGDIPDESVQRLLQIGKWMAFNSESIYGTTASPFEYKLPFGRCTQKPGKLYLHVFDWPENKTIRVPIRNDVAKASILAQPDPPLEVSKNDDGVTIRLPDQMPDTDATVIALDLSGPVDVITAASAATMPATRRGPAAATTPAIPVSPR
jgi:alpha-L-fucosidase